MEEQELTEVEKYIINLNKSLQQQQSNIIDLMQLIDQQQQQLRILTTKSNNSQEQLELLQQLYLKLEQHQNKVDFALKLIQTRVNSQIKVK